jgi:hypothetical protein
MYYNDVEASGSKNIADLFNKYFSDQFNDSTYPFPDIPAFVNNNLSSITLHVDDVYNVLLNLDCSKCNGPEGIPVIVYKQCASVLAFTLPVI